MFLRSESSVGALKVLYQRQRDPASGVASAPRERTRGCVRAPRTHPGRWC